MGSRERDSKSLQDKLKELFKGKGGGPVEMALTPELERELAGAAGAARRLRALRDLTDRVTRARLPEGAAERVWVSTRDLVQGDAEARAAALGLWRAVCEHQPDELLLMRPVLFRLLRETATADPADPARLRLLHALLDGGRNIRGLEGDVGPLLTEWLPVADPAELPELLRLATNVVKYNASALDEPVLCALVGAAGALSCAAPDGAAVAALGLLEAVLCYALLPRAALPGLVRSLCVLANADQHTAQAWKLVRYVAGADLGAACVLELCRALRAAAVAGAGAEEAAGVRRGAVFFLHSALWGPNRVASLRVSYLAVLPALHEALESNEPVVAYEVVVAVQALLTRAGELDQQLNLQHELHEPAWAALLGVLRRALQLDGALRPRCELLHEALHAALTAVEQLHAAGRYGGDVAALVDLVDECAQERPEASALWAAAERAQRLSPARRDWPTAALQLHERYVRAEPRRAVRLHALNALVAFVARHRVGYGDEPLERCGLPVLAAAAADADPVLRAHAARALADLAAHTSSDVCTDLIDLLEKILNRPFEMYVGEVCIEPEAEEEAAAARAAAAGLVALVHATLLRAPAAHPARALLVLLDHLDQHYRRPALFQHHPDIRLKILELVCGLRANAFNCVGHCYDETGAPVWGAASVRLRPLCAPALVVEPLTARGQPPPPGPAGALAVPAGRLSRALRVALEREAQWAVLGALVRALPALLVARALAAGRRAQDLDVLAGALCSMVSERGRGQAPPRPSLSEFHALALAPLCALAPYHAYLEPHTQQRIVHCLLKYGMVLRAPQPYINALTIFALEMRETMVKMLPEVLLDLSKISDTQVIASPMLEFLSTLTRLPRVFASFVEDQYMSVFAILLPYTNPSRYNHYVVSLAHHVIAAWFLKCRLSYRRNFVRFIIHGLHNYIILPFEEQLQQRGPAANEDSSQRQRSSSLGSRVRAPRATPGSASAAFHVELTETCVDLLARYAATPCSVKPQRSDTAELVFGGGRATTWLVGHKLVTVTTSSCQQGALRQGLCERCAAHGRAPEDLQGAAAYATHAAHATHATHAAHSASNAGGDEGWARGEAGAAGACPCWCSRWAELHVRAPTGDVAWAMRVQNRMGWDQLLESPLEELAARLTGREPAAPPPPAPAPPSTAAPAAPAVAPKAAAVPTAPATRPIDIPAAPPARPRHPVRRTNSSPEMSSSWKMPARERPPDEPPSPSPPPSPPSPAAAPAAPSPPPEAMIVLPVCEPAQAPPPAQAPSLHALKKAAKKSDMRVSCEAIPEEISGTSPAAAAATAAAAPHPHLMTHHSDPGEAEPAAKPEPPAAPVSAYSDELPPLARSWRANTISVMSPARPPRPAPRAPPAPAAPAGAGVTPSFVFLQLYHNMSTHPLTPPAPGEAPAALHPLAERPLRIRGEQHERTIKNLDRVPPVETYKVGVLYAAPGQQDSELAILQNEHGSVRYCEFLGGLGELVSLAAGAPDPPDLFLNLEKGGRDGDYAYVWADDVAQVLFHVATAMPCRATDPTCNEKRKYIGNDYVSIVYNDSGADFNIHTIKGQFNSCIVVVEPYEHGMNRVLVKTKDERLRTQFLAHLDTQCVCDANAALLARQTALHCSLAAQISQSLSIGAAPYASNALERLRHIKRLRRRVEGERLAAHRAPAPYHHTRPDLQQRVAIDDFNDYT